MNKRPLFVMGLSCFVCAVVFCVVFPAVEMLYPVVAVLVLAGVFSLLCAKARIVSVMLFSGAAMLVFALVFSGGARKMLLQNQDKTVALSGRVREVYTSGFALDATLPSGERTGILVWCTSDELPERDQTFSGEVALSPVLSTDRFDSQSYYRSRGIFLQGQLVLGTFGQKQRAFPESFLRDLNEKLSDKLEKQLSLASGSFYSATILGNKAALEDDVRESFNRLGISHLLAVSGMHLSVLCAFLAAALRKIFKNRVVLVAVQAAFVLFYMAFSGLSPSVTRAGIMLILSYLASLIGRDTDPLTNISVAVLLMVFFNPFLAAHAGFQLSVSATVGVQVAAPALAQKLLAVLKNPTGFVRSFIRALSVSFSAYLCTLPILSLHFSQSSVWTLPANLLFPLLFTPVFLIGAVYMFFAPIPVLGTLLAPIARFVSAVFLKLVSVCAALAGPQTQLSGPAVTLVLWTVLGVFLYSLFFAKEGKRLGAFVLAVLFCCGSVCTEAVLDSGAVSCYSAAFGKNLLFIETYGNRSIVVGHFSSVAQMQQARLVLEEQNITDIDLLLLLPGKGSPRQSFSELSDGFAVHAVSYFAGENLSTQAAESLAQIPYYPADALAAQFWNGKSTLVCADSAAVMVETAEKNILILPADSSVSGVRAQKWDLVITAWNTPPDIAAKALLCGRDFWGKEHENKNSFLLSYGKGVRFRIPV